MRAELMILGRRLDMAPRQHRRTLVVLIYAGLTAMLMGSWFIDRWHVTGVYMIFATILINRLLLGGYNFGGLIRPFSNKAPRPRMEPPPLLALGLRVYLPGPDEGDFRNDERELAQRDHAHYQAYQGLCFALMGIWLISDWSAMAPKLLAWLPVNPNLLLYGLVLAAIVLSQTLPQSILLWTEPDLEEAGE